MFSIQENKKKKSDELFEICLLTRKANPAQFGFYLPGL
jgi:hypothetical protein